MSNKLIGKSPILLKSSFLLLASLFLMLTPVQSQELSIENVFTVQSGKSVQISFDTYTESVNEELQVYIRYLDKQSFSENKIPEWSYAGPFPTVYKNIEIDIFDESKDYFFMIAATENPASPTVINDWSEVQFYQRDESWSIGAGITIHILALLGALGLFIFGMKTMSDGIQKGTANLLRKLIGGMTSNQANGIFYGFLTTSIVQSSSATTVMVVSFVNNGILNLKQSIAVVMGANIGTTITAWLIAYFGFKAFMPDYALVIFLVAIIFMFSAKNKLRPWGEVLTGIALLFFGLIFLKDGIPDIKNTIDQFVFLHSISGTTLWSVILAVLIGAVITIVFQSSIAALVLIILLTAKGILPYEMGLGMVLGSNLGTTITANIAALNANVHAKRAARAHLVFNLFGVIWMVFLFPYFITFISYVFVDVFGASDPLTNPMVAPLALAFFHTSFNIINATILYFFVDLIAQLIVKIVPTRGDDEEVFQLGYIKAGMLSTPELTIIEAKKEIAKFGKITSKMSGFFKQLLTETDKKKKNYLYAKIDKYEDITDRVELELTNYLTQTSEGDLTEETSQRVRSMMAIANYLERIADVFFQMSLTLNRKEKEKIWFSPDQRQNLQKMLALLDEAFVIMIENLRASEEDIQLKKALLKEKEIDKLRDKLRAEHFENVEKHEYNIKSGIIYSDLFYSCEKIGDHIMNVSEALVDEQKVEQVIQEIHAEKLQKS